MCIYQHRCQHHTECASTIDAAIHTTSNLESITNSTQVSQKLFKITEDKRHVSEPPDTVHWSLNHRAASWEKKQGAHVQRRSSLYHTLNNREPRHGYDTSGCSIHIVQLYLQLATMTKWFYNCTHNVAISYTFNFTIASTYVHAHLFVCWIRQCRTMRCRRLAQETAGTESQGRSSRPVPYRIETPNRGQRSGQSNVELSKHCHYMSLHLSVTVAYSHMHRSALDLKCTPSRCSYKLIQVHAYIQAFTENQSSIHTLSILVHST